jgi:biotin synthase
MTTADLLDPLQDNALEPSITRIAELLRGGGPDESLFAAARQTLLTSVGDGVYLRGIVEISNHCRKNCLYCGLRRDNRRVRRYSMSRGEILAAIRMGYSAGLRSFLLQAGELPGPGQLDLVCDVLSSTASEMPGVRMVLSLGELPGESLARLRAAGAHRYLLRIEASSEDFYRRFHPDDGLHDHAARKAVLADLRGSGWQTGTGVLIGLPGQTAEHLAQDLLFMRELDIDMCGMGPFLVHEDTPMRDMVDELPDPAERVLLTLRMIALARLMMPTINISATTALQTLHKEGLELGLSAGANVVMPNLTPAQYRKAYNLYQGKVQVDDGLLNLLSRLETRCAALGRRVIAGDPGDPVHFKARTASDGDRT